MPGLDSNIGAAEGKTLALQGNDMDIEGAFWWNVDGVVATLRYRSVVNVMLPRAAAGKNWRIEYTRSIIGIGDPENGGLIAPQCHLMRISTRVAVDQLTASATAGFCSHAAESGSPHPVANSISSKGALFQTMNHHTH